MKMPGFADDSDDTKLTLLYDSIPAEFDPHDGTWMVWPEGADGLAPGPTAQHIACAALAQEIAGFETVTVSVSARQKQQARELLGSDVRIVESAPGMAHPTEPGPAFIANRDGAVRIVNWRRNAWNALCCNVNASWPFADSLAVESTELELANGCTDTVSLQGASIRSDGDGTFFVAEESISNLPRFLRPNRREFTATLEACCGARKVIWLPRGFPDERGIGRLDNLLAPVTRGVVALAWIEDPDDPRFEVSREAFTILSAARDAGDRALEVVRVRSPAEVQSTYVNFQLCDDAVIIPTFDDAHDAEAAASLRTLFRGRRVVELPAIEPRYVELRMVLRAAANRAAGRTLVV